MSKCCQWIQTLKYLNVMAQKLSLCYYLHAMQRRYMEKQRYSSTNDLSSRWKWEVSFMPLPLYPREKSCCEHWEEKKNFSLPGIKPQSSSPWSVTMTQLPQLLMLLCTYKRYNKDCNTFQWRECEASGGLLDWSWQFYYSFTDTLASVYQQG
jgi:hypothetical protein